MTGQGERAVPGPESPQRGAAEGARSRPGPDEPPAGSSQTSLSPWSSAGASPQAVGSQGFVFGAARRSSSLELGWCWGSGCSDPEQLLLETFKTHSDEFCVVCSR